MNIAELETLNLDLQNRNGHLKYRIAELESTLKVALEVLEMPQPGARSGFTYFLDYTAKRDAAIKQIKEVLHG